MGDMDEEGEACSMNSSVTEAAVKDEATVPQLPEHQAQHSADNQNVSVHEDMSSVQAVNNTPAERPNLEQQQAPLLGIKKVSRIETLALRLQLAYRCRLGRRKLWRLRKLKVFRLETVAAITLQCFFRVSSDLIFCPFHTFIIMLSVLNVFDP